MEVIGNGAYTINQIENLKKYYISQKDYDGPFGKKDVLRAKEKENKGNNRFYVMALEDSNTSFCSWEEACQYQQNGWVMPSKEQWAAFSKCLGININTYRNENFKTSYWSSSMDTSYKAWVIRYAVNSIESNFITNYKHYVRLSTIF